jgi:hypothetical protein
METVAQPMSIVVDGTTYRVFYITVATLPHPVLDRLRQSVSSKGEHLTILGQKENRPIGWAYTGNFGLKLREVQSFVNRPDGLDTDIILFTDAYDVIYCGTMETIVREFLQYNRSIVFGCETECNPVPSLAALYPTRTGEFPYLNSGMFIGYAGAVRKCMETYVYEDKHDDQLFWTRQYLANPTTLGLDTTQRLFLNTFGMNETYFFWDGTTAMYRTSTPQCIHVNGPDKISLSTL